MKVILVFLSILMTGTIWESRGAAPLGHDISDSNPSVLITFLVRNKRHTLPYFLGCLEKLNYPKHKISLFIRSDHNVDASIELLEDWLPTARSAYKQINAVLDEERGGYAEEEVKRDWVVERFENVINLREEALNFARKTKSDYIFFVDSDNFLEHEDTLHLLMNYNKTLIAPMMESYHSYSNFWGNTTESGFHFRKNEDTDQIRTREKKGVFPVAVVHSTFLIDLRKEESGKLTFKPDPEIYAGHLDDVVIFNFNARHEGIDIWLSNEHEFGHLPAPWFPPNNLKAESWRLLRLHMEHLLADHSPFPISTFLSPSSLDFPPKSKVDGLFDGIFVINLRKRRNRRRRLELVFNEWGIEAEFLEAVDGRNLTAADVQRYGMSKLADFKCPFTGRDLTYGEIGCFMSHWTAWKEAERRGLKRVWIMEDDVDFERDFKEKLEDAMRELEEEEWRRQNKKWDLLYLGKRKTSKKEEKPVENSRHWLWPENSFWALSYVLSETGVRKVMDSRPLEKLLPVDLIFPILFDKYSNEKINRHFEPRNMVALTLKDHLCHPAKYRGQDNYSSDTDSKDIIPEGFIPDFDNPNLGSEGQLVEFRSPDEL